MLLSIILPVYNVEQYISDCLNSLLHQGLSEKEYEIICVNDGSEDDSLIILEKYAEKHHNIKIVSKENEGVSIARNTGLKLALGEYIWFVDPDDFIDGNCIVSLLDELRRQQADYLVLNMEACSEDTRFSEKEQKIYTIYADRKKSPRASVWVYIVKRELLITHNIHFQNELPYGEDYLWALLVWLYGDKYLVTEDKIYHYRTRENSAMTTRTVEKMSKHVDSMIKLAEMYSKLLNREKWDKKKYKEIKRRVPECTQVVLWDLLLNNFEDTYRRSILERLEREGYYPYKMRWSGLISGSGYKQVVMNFLGFLFPCKIYYLLIWKITRKIKRGK